MGAMGLYRERLIAPMGRSYRGSSLRQSNVKPSRIVGHLVQGWP